MQYVTEQDLLALRIGKSGEELTKILEFVNGKLQKRVDLDIANRLSENKFTEYVNIKKRGIVKEISDWLMWHIPDLDDIVAAEVSVILDDLSKNAQKV